MEENNELPEMEEAPKVEKKKAPKVKEVKEPKGPKYKMIKEGMQISTKYGVISQENLNDKTYKLIVALGLEKYVEKR